MTHQRCRLALVNALAFTLLSTAGFSVNALAAEPGLNIQWTAEIKANEFIKANMVPMGLQKAHEQGCTEDWREFYWASQKKPGELRAYCLADNKLRIAPLKFGLQFTGKRTGLSTTVKMVMKAGHTAQVTRLYYDVQAPGEGSVTPCAVRMAQKPEILRDDWAAYYSFPVQGCAKVQVRPPLVRTIRAVDFSETYVKEVLTPVFESISK